ncbi:hypothetical protein LguiA_005757 [Lonicera macranthoides]
MLANHVQIRQRWISDKSKEKNQISKTIGPEISKITEVKMGEVVGLEARVREVRKTFRSGKTKGVEWRKSQLRGILKLIDENEDKIFDALQRDLGKHPVEAYRDEVGVLKKSAIYALENIDKWMSPRKGRLPLLFFPAKGQVLPEPLALSLDPLIGAISAGNTAFLKPSELAPECSSFLANTIPLYLDSKAIKVIEGGTEVAGQLLQLKWDKIFFTGSPRVGRIVMSAAAKYLTPVTLELGGKCPTILDSLSNPSDLKV